MSLQSQHLSKKNNTILAVLKQIEMKQLIIIFGLFLIFNVIGNSQNTDPKHKNFFKSPAKIETELHSVSFKNIVAKIDYAKMAVEIKNISNDYLMFRTEEPEFVFLFGSYCSKEDLIYILPNSAESITLKVSGDNKFHVDHFNMELTGLYKLSAKGGVQEGEEFRLPANKNNIEVGSFKVSLIKTSQKTKETYGKFECEYIGDAIGIIDPSRISVRVDGTDLVYANDVKKSKSSFLSKGGPIFLRKGEKTTLKAVFHIPGKIADMQFSLLYIMWGDTFREVQPEKLTAKKVEFVLDEGLTHGKNK